MILVVEDNSIARDYLANQLSRRGYDVRAASNVDEAMLRVKEKSPKFILLDVMLPTEKESQELVRRLQNTPEAASSKVVVTTGLPGDGPLQWPKVVGILRKPFTVDTVINLMANVSDTLRPRPRFAANEGSNNKTEKP